jgi:prolyl-tRNA synthetase
VVLDDRGERPGAMFADWELIGVPQRVVISERGLKEGQLECRAAATRRPAACRWPRWRLAASLKDLGSPHEAAAPACCWG